MKTSTRIVPFPRSLVLSAMLILLPAAGAAREPGLSDPAARALARAGRLEIDAAGPYVEHGTFRIQVLATLGRPLRVLSDGAWVYPRYVVEESTAEGTLVIRFAGGRVSELTLVTPEVLAALGSDQRQQISGRVATTGRQPAMRTTSGR